MHESSTSSAVYRERPLFFKRRFLVLYAVMIIAASLLTTMFMLTSQNVQPPPPSQHEIGEIISLASLAMDISYAPAEVVEPPPLEEITIAFGGDVMFDTFIYNWISANGIDYPWEDVSSIFQEADIALVNFESSSSLRGASTKPEGYGFRSPPHTLQSLVNAGIDYVSLGNNHVLDYGREAFADTLDNLAALGIAYSGAGLNLTEAERAAVIECKGLRIGFLSYSAIIPHDGWRPGDSAPGIAPLYSETDIHRALANIAVYKEDCDYLIVIPHWGIEYAARPSAAQRELAHRIIDAGADLIIGGHPHVLQGMELYRQKPIFYSVGNFIFLKMDDDAGKTAVFSVTFNREGFISYSLQPVFIDSCKANLLDEEHWMYDEIKQRFQGLSAELAEY